MSGWDGRGRHRSACPRYGRGVRRLDRGGRKSPGRRKAGKLRAKLAKLGSKHASKHYAALIGHAKRPDSERRDAKGEVARQKFDATIVSPPRAALGMWTHVVAQLGRGFALTRVNLELNSSVSFPAATRGDRHPSQNELWISDRSNEQQSFDGAIDDVAIWNRRLSPIELDALYNEGIRHGILRTTLPSDPEVEDDD